MTNSNAERLMDILVRERDLLLCGDLHSIENILQEKSSILADIDFQNIPIDLGRDIISNFEVNQKLGLSTIRGVKSAIQKLNEAADEKCKVSVYTAWGTKTSMFDAEPRRSKKY